MTPSPANVAVERAWKLLALALIGAAVVVVNFDPIIDALPNIPQGAGQTVSETGKQSLALAIVLLVLGAVGAAVVIRQPGNASAVGFSAVMGAAAVGAVVVFLLVLAFGGDDRRAFALGTLIVVGVAALASLFSVPSFSYANFSAKPIVAVVGGIALLIGYGLALNYMFNRATTENTNEWERLIALFATVEAIAFAAVGAVLGSEVQKSQTVAEAAQADENEENLEVAKEKGQEIAGVAATAITPPGDTGGAAQSDPGQAREEIARLRGELASIPGSRRRRSNLP